MRHSFLFKILVLLIISVCVCPDSFSQIKMSERNKPDQIGGTGHQTTPKPTPQAKPKPKQERKHARKPRGRKKSDDKQKQRDSKPQIGSDKSSDGMFVYYADVVKLNGWLVGVGEPLTQEQARQLDSYFKLSRKNAAGNWCFVEAFDKRGNANDEHAIKPYFDDLVLDFWLLDDYESVSKWEFVADSLGGAVVEERWLLADSSAVLNFHPIQIDDREIIGLYTDQYGRPICAFDDEDYEMTDVVRFIHIFRDEYGFDVTIDEFGADSIPEKYQEAASYLLKKFDSHDP